jgi:hypothetical protein
MLALPLSNVAAASALLAAGWSPLADAGHVAPPLGMQVATAHLVPDWTWQAMTLMQLATDSSKVVAWPPTGA